MVWILLLVHITLHGMIGGLLKHFPKAVCGIIFFICGKKNKKTLLNVTKKKEAVFFCCCFFFISVSIHPSQSRTPRAQVQFKLRERDFFFSVVSLLLLCDGSAGCLFLSLALIRKYSQHGIVISHGHSSKHSDAIFPSLISRP